MLNEFILNSRLGRLESFVLTSRVAFLKQDYLRFYFKTSFLIHLFFPILFFRMEYLKYH